MENKPIERVRQIREPHAVVAFFSFFSAQSTSIGCPVAPMTCTPPASVTDEEPKMCASTVGVHASLLPASYFRFQRAAPRCTTSAPL